VKHEILEVKAPEKEKKLTIEDLISEEPEILEEEQLVCANCGYKNLKEGMIYCPNCRQELDWSSN